MEIGFVVGVVLASIWNFCRMGDREEERLDRVVFLEQCLSLPAVEHPSKAVDQ